MFFVLIMLIRKFRGPHSIRMRENADQKNSEYGHFSRSNVFSESTRNKKCLFSWLKTNLSGKITKF